MNRRFAPLVALACAVSVGALWWLGTSSTVQPAHAEEPEIGGAVSLQMRCKTFETELGATLELPGGDSEPGRWVQEQRGWTIYTVDYEAVQKATGYPLHLVQVCVTPM